MADAHRRETTDDMDALLEALPPEIGEAIRALPNLTDVIEVVMDLGRRPEARFGAGGESVLLDREISEDDLQHVVVHVGSFGDDNRAGIERTLHRISAIRNRSGKVVGLTCRIGRAVFGTIDIIQDLVESGKSVLILGRPGIGKTTMLREVARVLADVADKRVVVVDTSNEIAGDGDIPHPGIGRARRMQVRDPRPAARGDDRGRREPHARGHRHRRDRHRAGGVRGAHHRRARRAAHRHRARQQPRQPDGQPDPVGPHRRHPDRDPWRRGSAAAPDPEDRPRAQGAADLRRRGRDHRPRPGDGARGCLRHGRWPAPGGPAGSRAALARRGRCASVPVAPQAGSPEPAAGRAVRSPRRTGSVRLAGGARVATRCASARCWRSGPGVPGAGARESARVPAEYRRRLARLAWPTRHPRRRSGQRHPHRQRRARKRWLRPRRGGSRTLGVRAQRRCTDHPGAVPGVGCGRSGPTRARHAGA